MKYLSFLQGMFSKVIVYFMISSHQPSNFIAIRNYFVFTPLLASTSVGTLEFRCITEPVRGYSKNISYHQAWCDSVGIARNPLLLNPNI